MINNKKITSGQDEFPIQFKKRDFIIGYQLTSNQKQFIESYVEAHYEKSFAHIATETAIIAMFKSDLLDPKLFPHIKINFLNKFNLIKNSMKQNQQSQMEQAAQDKNDFLSVLDCHKTTVFPRYRPK